MSMPIYGRILGLLPHLTKSLTGGRGGGRERKKREGKGEKGGKGDKFFNYFYVKVWL